MKTLFVLTEGQTETNFVQRVLAPYFIDFEIQLIPNTIITKSDSRTGKIYKGGISYFSKIDSEIKKQNAPFCQYKISGSLRCVKPPVCCPG